VRKEIDEPRHRWAAGGSRGRRAGRHGRVRVQREPIQGFGGREPPEAPLPAQGRREMRLGAAATLRHPPAHGVDAPADAGGAGLPEGEA